MPNTHEADPRIERRSLQVALRLVAYFLIYLLLDWASYLYPVVPLGITPWNPPTGVSLFLLLAAGIRYWPALFVAAFFADLIVRGAPANVAALSVAAGIITAGYTIAARLLKRHLGMQAPLQSTRDLVVFLVVTTVTSLVVAVAFVGWYWRIGMVAPEDFIADVVKYWVGDMNGILVLTPALFCLLELRALRRALGRLISLEVILQFAAIVIGLVVTFVFSDEYPSKFFYIVFLPLIWVSARWGLPGSALGLLVIQLGLIAGMNVANYHSATFVELQLLMTGLCMTGLTVGAMSSHRSRLEASLQEKQTALSGAQQLASAGELTSALAHQLNQPMTALSSYIDACQLLFEQRDVDVVRMQDLLGKVAAEARRASGVVSRLRDFYQRGVTDIQKVQAGPLLDGVVQMLRRNADRLGVEVVVSQSASSRILLVDPVQIENALQNVLQNAIDAVTPNNPDRRIVEVAIESAEDAVAIRVRDTGGGVTAEAARHLFEPFNTSKVTGMGMGLVIARSLVRANGGDLVLETSDATGACFVMRLPAA